MAIAPDESLLSEIGAYLRASSQQDLSTTQSDGLMRAMYCLKDRAKTFEQLLEKAHFILTKRPVVPDEKSARSLDAVSRGMVGELTSLLQDVTWKRDALETVLADYAVAYDIKLGKIAQPVRAALAGRSVSPSVFDMMLVLGRRETLARFADAQG